MTMKTCLNDEVRKRKLTQTEADDLLARFEAYAADRHNAGSGNAEQEAKAFLSQELRADAAEKKRQVGITARVHAEVVADLDRFRLGSGKQDIAEAAISMIDHNGTAPFFSAEGRRKAIIGQVHAYMESLLFEFRRSAVLGDNLNIGSKRFNFRHGKMRLDNVVSEAFGVATGDDAARGMAQAWIVAAEWLRLRFNAAGGAIAKLDNWGLPQSHNALALRKAGLAEWKKRTRVRLERSRMRDPLTGRAPNGEQLDTTLNHIFESVTTEGWNTRPPSRQARGRGALANQHAEHRFLVFKSPRDWLAYQREFGEGDPFSTMMKHINLMARDIAAMERFGPNPNAEIEFIKQTIENEAQLALNSKPSKFNVGKAENAKSKAGSKIAKVTNMWDDARGSLATPDNAKFANTMGGLRNIVTASVLGSAQLAAIGDTANSMMARYFTGLPMARTVTDIVAQMSRGSRRDAVAAGLILDSAQHAFAQQARYVGSLGGPQWTAYLVDRVLTWQGLSPWTQSGRHAFGMSFQRAAADMRDLPYDQLPVMFRDMFRRWGLGEDGWNSLRAIVPHDYGRGATFLRPQEIAAVDQNLADRYLEMIIQETEFAIPSSTVRSRALLSGRSRGGNYWGEVQKSFLMFKSFGATVGVLNALRVVDAVASPDGQIRARGAAYAGGLLISMTLIGGLAIQLKQLIPGGRDARPINTKKFWGAALLQGGGLGLYGDFLFADVNRYGGGFAKSLGGPLIEHLSDAWTLTGGNMIELAQGKTWKETKAGREFVKFLRGNTPGGSLWWARLGYERVVLDQLQFLIDPEANASYKRRQQFWKKEMGQEYYWRPGDLFPYRTPAVVN